MKKEIVDSMTLQEAMDYAVQKLVKQGRRCKNSIGGCLYGDGKGNHCGVGWLLDEDDQDLMTSGLMISMLALVYESSNIPNLIKENIDAFSLLQDFHDINSKKERILITEHLRDVYKIDTSGEHWQKWIAKGNIDYAKL